MSYEKSFLLLLFLKGAKPRAHTSKCRKHDLIASMDYDDIINLPYPRDDWNFLMKHPRMSIANRAKIFSPFAALRGHNESIAKTAERHLEDNRDENRWDSTDFEDVDNA